MATATATKKMNRDIRRNDNVQVIAGRDAGKQGRVLRVVPARGKVLVEHVMMVKKHVKPNPQRNIKGGVVEREAALAIANVQLVCPECGNPSRIGRRLQDDGRRVRYCVKCKGVVDK